MKKLAAWMLFVLLTVFCLGAAAEIQWPEALTAIEDHAFENNVSLTGVLAVPDTVEQIGQGAFSGTGLFALVIPQGIRMLGEQALAQAAYVRIEDADTQVGELSGVRYIIAPAGSGAAEQDAEFVAESDLVEQDGFYYARLENGALKLLSARDAAEQTGSVTIPAAVDGLPVKVISEYAFMGCEAVTELNLPGSAKLSYRESAIADCSQATVQFYGPGSDYPDVIPGIDFGGASVQIADYWTGSSQRSDDPTQEQADRYAYEDWIDEAYNVHVYQQMDGDWGTCADAMRALNADPRDALRIYIIEPGKVSGLIRDGIAAPLDGRYVDLYSSKWNAAERAFLTIGGEIYGCYPGNSEPRQCLFFNKLLLTEAGIDWQDIYDMQQNGTWTWAALENLLRATTRDADGDGETDNWGIVGSADDFYVSAVFSNGGSFFDSDANGDLYPAMSSMETLDALSWAQDVMRDYWMPRPEDGSWDWYKQAWQAGNCAFYMAQTYAGFSGYGDMAGLDWGCVAFPTASSGGHYVNLVSDNLTLIPACYDEETVARLMLIYDLWTERVPGSGSGNAWRSAMYQYTDDTQAIDTYGMLREPAHCVVNKVSYLGTQNDVLGSSLLWQLGERTAAELVSDGANVSYWQGLCDEFNGN